MDAEQARARLTELAEREKADPDELYRAWDALAPTRPQDVLGNWRGRAFRTGHPVEAMLAGSNWHGKNFRSPEHAEPLVCRREDGTLYSDTELGQGEASLWPVEFRGEVTATMVYDGRPVLDHFKAVDGTLLLGIMNGKGVLDAAGRHFFFLLERDDDR